VTMAGSCHILQGFLLIIPYSLLVSRIRTQDITKNKEHTGCH